jgi:hypothetical protein
MLWWSIFNNESAKGSMAGFFLTNGVFFEAV